MMMLMMLMPIRFKKCARAGRKSPRMFTGRGQTQSRT
jgi:hypothetical protein